MDSENKFNQKKEAFLRTRQKFGIVEQTIKPTIVYCQNCPSKVVAVTVSEFNYVRLCLECATQKAQTQREKLNSITPEENYEVWRTALLGALILIGFVLSSFFFAMAFLNWVI